MRNILILACLIALAGCGGGGGGGSSTGTNPPPTNADPGGIWFGTAHNTTAGLTFQLIGVSIGTGEFRFLDDQGVQYFGSIKVSGTAFTGSLTAYAPVGTVFSNGSPVLTGNISGTISQRASFSGQYTLSTGERGTISLTYDALYDRDSSIPLVSGTWQDDFGNTYTVDSQGSIFAQDSAGCVYSGNISVVNSAFNAYRVNLQVSNCGPINGSYNGLAVLDDFQSVGDDRVLIYQLSNVNFALTASLTKF